MIGVFDSGVGGLSVYKELLALMPDQRYIYVSDSAHCPYGPKSKEYIVERALKISRFLIDSGADLIVVACNTATAAAIEVLRSSFDVKFVGMEPAVKPAALNSATGVIGVLATQGTLKGELYLRTLHKFASNTKVIEQVGHGLVELVEQGNTDTPQTVTLLQKYLQPMIEANADHVVLGCTHYPFLSNTIEQIAGGRLTIVNPAPAIARQAHSLLELEGKAAENSSGANFFYTTGDNLSLLTRMATEITRSVGERKRSDSEPFANRFCTIHI